MSEGENPNLKKLRITGADQLSSTFLQPKPQHTNVTPIGNLLVEKGLISGDQLVQAIKKQKESGEVLGRVILDMGLINESQLISTLSEQLEIMGGASTEGALDVDDESKIKISPEAISILPAPMAIKANAMPISLDATTKTLTLGVLDSRDIAAIDEIKFRLGVSLKIVEVSSNFLESAWAQYYGEKNARVRGRQSDSIQAEFKSFTAKLTQENVVPFINRLLSRAAELRASDIHIDPFEAYVVIRFRIDGKLYEAARFPKNVYSTFIGRLKIIANIDIGEKKSTVDGRLSLKLTDKVQLEFRVSILNAQFGERVVLRIARESTQIPTLNDINIPKIYLDVIKQKIKTPHGLIVVTGPTGSGKTTTLYAILSQLADMSRNVLTIEDPVEISLPGASQIQVEADKGHTFAKILRSVLRQDPDVIMIGEIRDEETATIAVRAAMTGHLVLCSLHTNDAISAVTRLEDMNVPPYYIGPALNLVIGQRLIRLLCDHCKKPQRHSKQMLLEFGFTPAQIKKDVFYQPSGCSHCHMTGYKGRIPVFEVLDVNTEFRDAVSGGEKQPKLRSIAKRNKHIEFPILLREYLRRGKTSMEEALPYLIER